MTVKQFYDYVTFAFGTDDVEMRFELMGYTHAVNENRLHLGFDVYEEDKKTVYILTDRYEEEL